MYTLLSRGRRNNYVLICNLIKVNWNYCEGSEEMLIKEGSKVKLIDWNDINRPVLEEIIVQEDIKFENEGYTFLLATRGGTFNAIFESDKIEQKSDNEFIAKGYFKDAVLVLSDKGENYMYESYMTFD